MKTSVKSKIPHGKPSRIPGVPTATRHPTSKLKPSPTTQYKQKTKPYESDETNNNRNTRTEIDENLNNVAFICSPNPQLHPNDNDASPVTSTVQEGSFNKDSKDFDENCEVLSVSSLGPSPIKILDSEADLISYNSVDNFSTSSLVGDFESFHDTELSQPVIDNYAPDLVAFRRFQEVLNPPANSGASSPTSEGSTTPPRRGRLPLPSSAALKTEKSLLRNSKKFPAQKSANTRSNLKPKTEYKSQSRPSSKTFSKQSKVSLPGKELHISPSNAMDYVRKITGGAQNSSEVSSAPRRRSRGMQEPQTMHRYNGKTDLNNRMGHRPSANTATRNDGKWSTDIDAAMNVPRRNSKQLSAEDTLQEVPSARGDRKKQYQETRVKKDFSSNSKIQSPTSSGSNIACKSPKIARPVLRPPRSRQLTNNDSTPDPKESESKPETIPKQDKNSDSSDVDTENEEKLDSFLAESNDNDAWSQRIRTRRSSVPSTTLTETRSRPRRRASEHFSKKLLPGSGEESGYSTNTASSSHTESNWGDHTAGGDSAKQDIVRMQDRLKQNERYMEILQNPEIVTFGHWRVKKEGNYAPEEMYGVTERRRIRSSSGSVSPVRRVKTPEKNGNKNAVVDEKDKEVKESGEDEKKICDDHSKEESELNLSALDNLPSLNSTAMMADFSMESEVFTPEKIKPSDSLPSHRKVLTPSQHRSVNKLLKGGLNGMVDQYLNTSDIDKSFQQNYSSPANVKDNKHDVSAASGGDKLAEKMDEMLEEYKIVRGALEQLHKALDAEEKQKKRLESENLNLIKKMDELRKENFSLKKEREMQKSGHQEQTHSRHRNNPESMLDLLNTSTQTERETQPTWYKTELSSVNCDLESAVGQLHQMKDLKEEFAQKINDAEQKLKVLMASVKGSK